MHELQDPVGVKNRSKYNERQKAESRERWKHVLTLRKMEMSLSEIAKVIGKTKARVHQILKKYKEDSN